MIRHYTDSELLKTLQRLEVVVDTREQKNTHITSFLTGKNVPCVSRKLDIGDYSCQLDGMTFEKDFCVERKANLDEIAGNFTEGRERFEREFIRARAFNTKVFLVVENASWQDIYSHNYSSKLNEKALLASLMAWQVRYNVTVILCDKGNSPKMIYGLLWYAAREKLMGG